MSFKDQMFGSLVVDHINPSNWKVCKRTLTVINIIQVFFRKIKRVTEMPTSNPRKTLVLRNGHFIMVLPPQRSPSFSAKEWCENSVVILAILQCQQFSSVFSFFLFPDEVPTSEGKDEVLVADTQASLVTHVFFVARRSKERKSVTTGDWCFLWNVSN